MRRRAVRFELLRVCTTQRLPLVTKGSCRRRRLKGSERYRLQSATRWRGKTYTFSSLPSRLRRATSPWSPRGGLRTPKRGGSSKIRTLPLISQPSADSFPPRGSLGLLQIRRYGTHPCLPPGEAIWCIPSYGACKIHCCLPAGGASPSPTLRQNQKGMC